jgi:uncharacterized membrane protein
VALALPRLVQHPFFDSRATNWLGLVTYKPITEDYVPLLPWLGVMWWGMAATQWLLVRHPGCMASAGNPGQSGDNPGLVATFRSALARLGRWSLTFYMLHQPILIGALSAWMWLTGRPLP